jgi:hypothetical protein
MNERINALKGSLPRGVLGLISAYDCHPTADLMRTVKMKRWDAEPDIPDGMWLTVEEPAYFLPPYDWLDRRTEMAFYFRRWCFDTLPEMDYLEDWVAEEFLEARVATWLDGGEWDE